MTEIKAEEVKEFHIGAILSVTTGVLLSLAGIGGVYEILDYMEDCPHYTHQLPAASKRCKPSLLKQFPQLSEVNAENVTPDNYKEWIKKAEEKYGTMLFVRPAVKQALTPV